MAVCLVFGLIVAFVGGAALAVSWGWLGYELPAAMIVAVVCGAVPVFLAKGPLACGLYACALKNYRDPPVNAATMRRGLETLPASVTAGIVLMLFQRIPPLAVAAGVYGVTEWLTGLLRDPNAGRTSALVSAGWMALSLFILMAGFAWGFWISTRTMFVVPLIADRGLRFTTALRQSWITTRRRFWELFLVRFLAYVVANLGAYVAILGILATLPVYFLVVMAAYEDRSETTGVGPSAGVSL